MEAGCGAKCARRGSEAIIINVQARQGYNVSCVLRASVHIGDPPRLEEKVDSFWG